MSAALVAYVDYAAYVEFAIERSVMPATFAQWFEIENVLRGDQLTLNDGEPADLLTDP